ncbi:Acyl dehydratase [Micromonospora pattaloongensis]|uniref:Acyl dehydratase n=1 Tax=Micromonospora pattaloongensis TaxID=405436 RepID=A0A1H3GB04_9ACTN|nr:MaoC/PaaZ C-terminal domain-containing protein [Micromonospora pattaloongensis]SDY00522.1 Acyl dehydratase [Micromonospora pattaloongensis]
MRSGTGSQPELFFEDLTPGHAFDLGVTAVDEAEMLAFARRFDPQPPHLPAAPGRRGRPEPPVASGLFILGLFMRAYVDHVLARAATDASPGMDEVRWLAPVHAGDRLAARLTVLGATGSTVRQGFGAVTLGGTMTRLDAQDRPEREVLRTRFRGWFALRE